MIDNISRRLIWFAMVEAPVNCFELIYGVIYISDWKEFLKIKSWRLEHVTRTWRETCFSIQGELLVGKLVKNGSDEQNKTSN